MKRSPSAEKRNKIRRRAKAAKAGRKARRRRAEAFNERHRAMKERGIEFPDDLARTHLRSN